MDVDVVLNIYCGFERSIKQFTGVSSFAANPITHGTRYSSLVEIKSMEMR